jgi:hypothetical protein
LALLRRPQTAFPLVAMGEQEVRVHITLRPFAEVVRRPGSACGDVPLGQSVVLLDNTGELAIPWTYTMPTVVPGFEDTTVLVGVAHMEDPRRRQYMHLPMEIMYEPVSWARFSVPSNQGTTTVNFPLRELNGPLREISFYLRCPDVQGTPLVSARLMVGNAVWRDEAEQWWRLDYGLAHRGGVRMFDNYIYGTVFGDAADWRPEDFQPAGTVNASRTDLRLDLTLTTGSPENRWELFVFGVGVNWMRFVRGLAVPLFKD